VKVFSTLFNKVVWFILFSLLFGAGCVFALRTFLNPPKVSVVPTASNNSPQQVQLTPNNPTPSETPSPTPSESPTQAATPTQTQTSPPPSTSEAPTPATTTTPPSSAPTTSAPSPTTNSSPISTATAPTSTAPLPATTPTNNSPLSPETSPTSASGSNPNTTPASGSAPNSSSTSTSPSASSALPALALPNQVILSVPKKLKPGATLAVYENLDNSSRPDPVNYSPSTTKEVAGLTLVSVKQSEFQEVSGYFLASNSGNHAFVISFPDNVSLDATNLRLKIDGQPLSNVKGGSVNLEKGWHKVDLFYFESNNYSNAANQIQVKWGLEGSNLKRLQTWREIS